ncbi:MAG: alpha/beta hydrolase [Actinobacteria bacterium]|nr:alpha/beta hydrolase [Actinomycetota bacterium]
MRRCVPALRGFGCLKPAGSDQRRVREVVRGWHLLGGRGPRGGRPVRRRAPQGSRTRLVWHEMFSGPLEYDDVAELRRISAPTLLIWGDADALVSRAMQEMLATCIPTAELTVYSGVGHTPRWDDPTAVAAKAAGRPPAHRGGRVSATVQRGRGPMER